DLELQREELLAADEIRRRTALGTLANQLAEALPGVLGRHVVLAHEKLEPLPAQGVGQQDLGLDLRPFNTFFREELGRPLAQPLDAPRFLASGCPARRLAHDRSPSPPRRCFLSKSRRAPTSSPRSPAMMASSL